MNTKINGILGISGCLLSTDFTSEISMWTSIICSALIALTTCGIQIYKMIRDRDEDKKGDKKDD